MRNHSVFYRAASLFCCAALLFSLTACSSVPKSSKEELTPVLTIDEYEVPYEQMRYFVRNYMDSEAAGDESYWTEAKAAERQAEIYQNTYDALKNQYAILSLAKQYGVNRDDASLVELTDSSMENIVESYEKTSDYVNELKANHMTHQVYRFFTNVDIVEEELYYAMLDAGALETDEEKLHDLIYGDEFIRVKQILIANDEGEDPAANRAEAESLRARALSGEDFDALVKEAGEDLFMFMNTDGYYICRGVWYREFEETAFALEIGEVSDVIETAAGYSVLMRCEKEQSYLDKNFDDLAGDWRDAQFSLAIEEKAASMKVTERPALAEYTLLTME